jgi:NAD(P)-dependent dehydrogenase (short-subunit alcohol dehydrogenase family)
MKKMLVCCLIALAAGPVPTLSAASESSESSPTVMVTGANRGIGLELARQYGKAGWQVIGTARKPESATELKELGARVVQLDVTDDASVARLAAELDGQPIDLLINNAGIISRNSALDATDIEMAGKILDVNVLGPMRVTQALLPNLSASNRKTIVNMTSGLGSIASNESGGFYGYRESKAALNMFTRSLASDLSGQEFIVVAMNPGWVQTDMGGPNATLTVEQSVNGIRAVVDSLTPGDSGTFRSYNGANEPW